MVLNLFFDSDNYYHASNWGVEKRFVFEDEKDLKRFIETLNYYRPSIPSSRFAFRKRGRAEREREKNNSPLVEIIAYCLMPNHYHLILKELRKEGMSSYLSKVSNSYTKYFNARHNRTGALFRGRFKAVKIQKSQVPTVSRFIHLDPLVRKIVRNLDQFPFSSYYEVTRSEKKLCDPSHLLSHFPGINGFINYTTDIEDYQNSLLDLKKLTLE